MMVAAYLLDISCAFKSVTSLLIGQCTKDYSDLLLEPWSSHLSPNILCKLAAPLCIVIFCRLTFVTDALEARRAKAQRCITSDIVCHADYLSSSAQAAYVQHLCRGLDLDFWPPIFKDIEGFTTSYRISRVKLLPRFTSATTLRNNSISYADFVRFAEKAEGYCGGLCLRCVKANKARLLERCDDATHAEL
jgi:hypothetical protein